MLSNKQKNHKQTYIDRGYKWDDNWLKIFVKNGWVKEKYTVTYEVV